MSTTLVATIRCDHIENGLQCESVFHQKDPTLSVERDYNSFGGGSYHTAVVDISFPNGWERKSIGSTFHEFVKCDLCPKHMSLYPLARDAKRPF